MSRNIARSDVEPISTDAQVYFTVPTPREKILTLRQNSKLNYQKIENETLLT